MPRKTTTRKRPSQAGKGPVLNFLRSAAGRKILGKAVEAGASALSKKIQGNGLRLAGQGAKKKRVGRPRKRK